jgi:predicted PurR-regulated permease PerM
MTLTIFSIIGHVLSIVFVIIAITTINQLRLVIQDKNEVIDWYKEYINKLKETNEMSVKLAQDCVKDRRQCSDAVMYAAHFLKPRKRLRMYRIANGKEQL